MAIMLKLRCDFWAEDKSTVRQTLYKDDTKDMTVKPLLKPQSGLR